jgi:SAM-dependent methyltransferase
MLFNTQKIRQYFVNKIYTSTNNSTYVKIAIGKLLKQYNHKTFVLNVGSGNKRLASHVKNLDIFPGDNVDYVCDAKKIPIEDNSVDLIITQETFEHILRPQQALAECYRVLKNGGRIYFQVPFVIGYHPGPEDFYRFTKEGIRNFLNDGGFYVEELNISASGAIGFYYIAVEFFAILFSGPINFIYIPLKGLFSVILCPLKIFEFWFRLSKQRDRIPAGYYAIGKKNL